MQQLSLNRKLAIMGFIMALGALLLAFVNPEGLNNRNQLPKYISVVSLAEKIKKRDDVLIVDIRSAKLYDEFHIPTAKNIALDSLLSGPGIQEENIIFYSGDDPLCRKLWSHISADLKKRSMVLYGGIHDWYDKLLYPTLPAKVDPNDSVVFLQVHDLSLFYGGQAEFTNDQKVMDYYKQDFDQASWPRSHRQNGLVRKGC